MNGIGLKTSVLFSFLLCSSIVFSQLDKQFKKQEDLNSSIDFVYKGVALKKKGIHIWGASPIIDNKGRTHLYVSQWPVSKENKKDFSGWYKKSQIAHYVSESPEGPFKFVRIAVKDKNGSFNAPHNPTIKFFDGKYVLCFIVNENDNPQTQRIIMYTSNDLSDNWKPAKSAEPDGTILRQPTNNLIWSSKSFRGVTNPTLLKVNGRYLLYYKGVLCDEENRTDFSKWHFGYGVSYSKNLEGPYVNYESMVTPENLQIEDAYAFQMDNKLLLIGRDIRGFFGSKGGGLTLTSTDGFHFKKSNAFGSYKDLSHYVGHEQTNKYISYRGPKEGHLERPQILFDSQKKPIYLFVATGLGESIKFGSTSYVFKLF